MITTQRLISEGVRRYMDAFDLAQADIAQIIGCTQTNVSARLRGVTNWSIKDLDRLIAAGVPLEVSVYGFVDEGVCGE